MTVPPPGNSPSSEEFSSALKNTYNNLTAKVSAVFKQVGFFSTSSSTSLQQRVKSTGFLNRARAIWEECKTGYEFPLLTSPSAEKWLETLIEKCPLEKREEFIESLCKTDVGSQVFYDVLELLLRDTWIKVGLSQEQFPEIDRCRNYRQGLALLIKLCPLRKRREFINNLCKTTIGFQVFYDTVDRACHARLNEVSFQTLEAKKENFLDWEQIVDELFEDLETQSQKTLMQEFIADPRFLKLLPLAKNLKLRFIQECHQVHSLPIDRQEASLKTLFENPLYAKIAGNSSLEEWKATGLSETFSLFVCHEIPDRIEQEDPDYESLLSDSVEPSINTMRLVIPIRKNPLENKSLFIQLSKELDSGHIVKFFYESRETKAIGVFISMMQIASQGFSVEFLIDRIKNLSTQDLWTLWKFSQDLQIPAKDNLFALAIDKVLAKRISTSDKASFAFIQEFVKPIFTNVSQRGHYCSNEALAQELGHEAMREAIYDNLANLLGYVDAHPEDWRIKNLLYHMRVIRLQDAKDQDLQRLFLYCPNLQSLDLSGCTSLTDEAFAQIESLLYLKNLNVKRCFYLKRALEEICQCKSLVSLNLEGCENLITFNFTEIKNLIHLETLNLSQCSQLKGKGLKAICEKCKSLRSLNLEWCEGLTGTDFTEIENLTNLKILNVSRSSLTDESLQAICKKCIFLRSLDLIFCTRLTAAGFTQIEKLINLETLNLEGCSQLTDEALQAICKCISLRFLNLRRCEGLIGAGFAEIKNLINLETLNLDSCSQLTDEALEAICRCISLRFLNLRHCKKLIGAGFAEIKNLINLETLNLDGYSQLTDEALEAICRCISLRSLNLGWCERLTASGFIEIQNLTYLETLHVSSSYKLTDEALEAICKKCRFLRSLSLCGDEKLTGTGFTEIKNLTDLEVFSLRCSSRLTDESLLAICKCLSLRILDLGWCERLTASGFTEIQNLSCLEILNLEGCSQLTDEALEAICQCRSLRALNLSHCKKLTESGLAKIEKLIPLKRSGSVYISESGNNLEWKQFFDYQ